MERVNPEVARQVISQLVLLRRYRLTDHAIDQLSARKIEIAELEHVLATGIIIEARSEERPPTLLVQGYVRSDEPLYVACFLDPTAMMVVVKTVYWRNPSIWKGNRDRK